MKVHYGTKKPKIVNITAENFESAFFSQNMHFIIKIERARLSLFCGVTAKFIVLELIEKLNGCIAI